MNICSADAASLDTPLGGEPRPPGAGDTGDPALPRDVVDQLGVLLRAFYRNLQQEPLPEHLIRILEHGKQNRGPRDGH